ncbi:MAG: lysylphosphatidylglycerol synthase domain-containing protein [Gemmatimonadales bacterium]|nr:lysylphosphatidylglycerol synthase domain-containing protein [Gemmatimonadales bacterium]
MTASPRTRWARYALPILVGVAIAAGWVVWTGGGTLWATLQMARPLPAIALVGVTAAWFTLRFVRSQFLLRHAGIRIPIRPALATYLAALPGTATPAYLGETIRAVFLRRRFKTPVRISLLTMLIERVHDVLALAILAILAAPGGRSLLGWSILGIAAVGWLLLDRALRATALARASARLLRTPSVILPAVALSLFAWGGAGALYWLAGLSLGLPISPAEGVAVLARSTLLGAMTLLPAGFGATGSAAILDVQRLVTAPEAIALVTLVRLGSTGVALALGGVFLIRELRGEPPAPEGVAHFDAIAADYSAQWSPHVWDLLLTRKMNMLCEALGDPASAGRGIDLGCGLGLQTAEIRRRGYDVIGVEPSVGLLRHRPDQAGAVVAADGLRLPFPNGSLNFVYVVGVLHHLPSRDAQAVALAEIARVLRPDGMLLVHESNPRNPLFRFYMTYLFPILKSIDEGTEWWIPPERWEAVPEMALVSMRYFTFLPDFIPRALMTPALGVEQLLERGPTYRYSAHYFAVLRRSSPA